jgi:hypothetical protein
MPLLDDHAGRLGLFVGRKRRLGLPIHLQTKLTDVRFPAL